MGSSKNGAEHEAPVERVLVAGATGYLRRFVAQELRALGAHFRQLGGHS